MHGGHNVTIRGVLLAALCTGAPAVAGATGWLHRCWHMVGTCFKAGAGWGRAAYDAALPPTHQKALKDMHSRMEDAYKTAKEHGAFTCAKQMSMGPPDLYIRHEELFNDAVTKLLGSAADTTKQQRGLLITGSWGMGKTTLARDVAKALSPKSPGECGKLRWQPVALGLETSAAVVPQTQQCSLRWPFACRTSRHVHAIQLCTAELQPEVISCHNLP